MTRATILRITRTAIQRVGIRLPDNFAATADGELLMHIASGEYCQQNDSPIASLVGDESPKMFLKGGLFDKIPAPGFKSFEQEEPSWLKIV